MRSFEIEEGIEKIFELAERTEKPAIVGIYGHANAGKTYLRKRCFNRAWDMGLKANAGMVDNQDSYSHYENPNFIFLEDYLHPLRHRSIEFVSKPIDITVLVKNEVLCDTVTLTDIYQNIKEGVYDIVINNFNSKRKILSPTIYSRSK